MISHKHKFIFIHPPRTGGTSIEKALEPYSDDKLAILSYYHRGDENPGVLHNNEEDIKHAKLSDVQKIIGSQIDTYTIMCSTRNPWERLASSYIWHQKETRGILFYQHIMKAVKGFIQTVPVLEYVDIPKLVPLIHFIHLENINEDFRAVCDAIGLPGGIELPHTNETIRDHYSEFYDPHSIRFVETRFKSDIDYFGYTFDDRCGARRKRSVLPQRHR